MGEILKLYKVCRGKKSKCGGLYFGRFTSTALSAQKSNTKLRNIIYRVFMLNGIQRVDTISESSQILSVHKVVKNYGEFKALDGLEFGVGRGEIVCLLGPNGAGKSTILRAILGFERIDNGHIELYAATQNSSFVFKPSFVPQSSEFPPALSVDEILEFVSSHYDDRYESHDIKVAFSLDRYGSQKASLLSGGQKRCLSMACGFIGKPQLTILDEPTVGVDLDARKKAWDFIKSHVKSGRSILFTTHMMDEAESMSQRIIIINNGRKVIEGSVEAIQRRFKYTRLEVELGDQPHVADDNYRTNDDLLVEHAGRKTIFWLQDSDEFIKHKLQNRNFSALRVRSATLEEILMHVYKHETHELKS